MTIIKYVGDHTAGVFLPGDVFVAHGETVEVETDVAKSLLAQAGQFERVKATDAKTPKNESES